MILVAVYLRVIKTQANTAKRNTTAVVTTMARVLRWKIRRRSRNDGSFSGRLFNGLLLLRPARVSCETVNAVSSKFISAVRLLPFVDCSPRVRFSTTERKLPIHSLRNRFKHGDPSTVGAHARWHGECRTP